MSPANRVRLSRRCLVSALSIMLAGAALPARAVSQDFDSSRLVSIGGDMTEIVYALGEERRLIARDTTSVYPPEALALPDVGYMRALSPEGILAMNPTGILAVEGAGPPEALAVLKQASIALETVPNAYSRDGILAKIRRVGALLKVEDKAYALERTVAADLDAAATAAAAGHDQRKRVLFILSLREGRVLAAGSHTAADGIIALAGAANATHDYAGYKPLTDEAIIEARPDVIVMMRNGDGAATSDAQILAHPALALTPAAENKAILRIDGAYMLGFGPRTAQAVRDLNAAIYGSKE